ncbi:MAG TPA: MBL fold metallo-hydrolase [Nitrososphaeraceae archaeon]|nr:MBL fold metallo-hydrolase [Nitrososphaeraceae archaeon]
MLQEVDKINITILVDNITDRLLPNSSLVKRPPLVNNEKFNKPPIAEHGFSALLEIVYKYEDKMISKKFLFDTGVSKKGIIYNSNIFGINFDEIETIILSHGHFDHFSGLISVLKNIHHPIEIIVHPDAFLKRWIVFPDGKKARMDILDEQEIIKLGGIIIKDNDISYLPRIQRVTTITTTTTTTTKNNELKNNSSNKNNNNNNNNRILITGEIPRITHFEKGFPLQYKEGKDEADLIPDPYIRDDQAIVILLKNKGLVIMTGCGHAGIINTINYAIKITGIKKVFAVIGGFHLTGEGYEKSIPLTVTDLVRINPEYIIPCHCTGWKASNEIIKAMPQKYIQTSVGSTFQF